MVPAVAQGAIAVEVRADDREVGDLVAALDHAPTRAAVAAERAFLARLGAGCTAAVAAHAVVSAEDELMVDALIGAPDGRYVRGTRVGPVASAEELGAALAAELLEGGGAAFLDSVPQ
jgi:hydroxymethylbilane synthase